MVQPSVTHKNECERRTTDCEGTEILILKCRAFEEDARLEAGRKSEEVRLTERVCERTIARVHVDRRGGRPPPPSLAL